MLGRPGNARVGLGTVAIRHLNALTFVLRVRMPAVTYITWIADCEQGACHASEDGGLARVINYEQLQDPINGLCRCRVQHGALPLHFRVLNGQELAAILRPAYSHGCLSI